MGNCYRPCILSRLFGLSRVRNNAQADSSTYQEETIAYTGTYIAKVLLMQEPLREPEKILITLPLSVLRVLIYGESGDETNTLPDIPHPSSGGVGDLAKIKILHYEVGQLIAAVDTEENYFHVELCTKETVNEAHQPVTIKWAELWIAREWRESNARLLRRRKASEAARVELSRQEELTEAIDASLAALPEELAIPSAKRAQIARNIATSYQAHDLSYVIKMLNLLDVIEKHNKQYETQ